MARQKKSRFYLIWGSVALVVLLLLFAFWPSATMVDIGEVRRGPMQLTIDEEGRTRLRDSYVVSAPADGRLQRVTVEAGDPVVGGKTVVARILPSPLDPRAGAQARAGVTLAEAGLRVARFDAERTTAEQALADANLAREQKLWSTTSTSREALETARRDAAAARAAADAARAAVAMRAAELEQAKAQLSGGQAISLLAPVSGRVLAIEQKSEATLTSGTPIMQVGDIESDLEVLVELLSTDAVQVSAGDRALIEKWGGDKPLEARVARIEPQGFTKVSALGVEEQRVNTIIRFADQRLSDGRLGSDFRVEARIVVWEEADALTVPSSALFRQQGEWAVFVVSNGRAEQRQVRVGRNNAVDAQILDGLNAGEQVILYPPAEVNDGTSVKQRQAG